MDSRYFWELYLSTKCSAIVIMSVLLSSHSRLICGPNDGVVNHKNNVEAEKVGKENCEYFDEVLVKHSGWGSFFSRFEDFGVERETRWGWPSWDLCSQDHHTWFYPNICQRLCGKSIQDRRTKNMSLRDLEQQWPHEMIFEVSERNSQIWGPFKRVLGHSWEMGYTKIDSLL